MHIWVTRTAPDNFLTARRLKDMGHRAFVRPALTVMPAEHDLPDRVPDAILFTSANGVRYHRWNADMAQVPVYAVGNHASELALRTGYATVTSTGGDAELIKALMDLALPEGARIVHFSAREVAPALPEHILMAGHDYAQVIVYDVADVPSPSDSDAVRMLDRIDAIMVHSARGAANAASVAQRAGWRGTVWALSEACAEPFRSVSGADCRIAATQAEHALLDLVPEIHGRGRGINRRNAELLVTLETGGPIVGNDR